MNINIMLVSTILLFLSILPFVFLFEKRKPPARDIVLIAVMSALSVIANLICAYTIPFHAGTAMVILTGIAFGPEAGFLTGALSRFVCNFFMGQGIWTPWEMLAWGILGALGGIFFSKVELTGHLEDKKAIKKEQAKESLFIILKPLSCIVLSELAGYLSYLFTAADDTTFWGWRQYAFGLIGILLSLLFRRKKLPTNYITMSVFTFIMVFVIYGGIMNIAALFMNSTYVEGNTSSYLSIEALKLLYITGAPYDALHALGASACVFVFGDSLIQKMERIKIKYGMYQKHSR